MRRESSVRPVRPVAPASRRPATSCWPWGCRRTPPGDRCGSAWRTSTADDVDRVGTAIGGVVESAARPVWSPPGPGMRVLAAMSGGVIRRLPRPGRRGRARRGGRAPGAVGDAGRAAQRLARMLLARDADDARRAADVLGIPFYVWDFAQRFREDVIDDFVAAYAAGETPNPCLSCNRRSSSPRWRRRRRRWGSTHWPPATTRGWSTVSCGARRRGQGPVLRPSRSRPTTSCGGPCSRSGTPQTADPRRRRDANSSSPTSPTVTTSASSRPATPGPSSEPRSAFGRGGRRR